MSDYFDPEDYENLEVKKRAIPVTQIKQWEQQAKRLAELEAQEAARQRAAALQQAGIPAELGGLFNPEADVDTIKTALQTLGVKTPTSQSLEGHKAAADLAAGANSAEATNLGTDIAAMKQAARSRRNAANADAERQKLMNLMQSNGVEVQPEGWQLPKQMAK